jgi:proteasome lid subunit RPN8/RPN11
MALFIPLDILNAMYAHGESAYPEEGAGLLLGELCGEERHILAILGLPNSRDDASRHNRYMITPQDMLQGELAAEQRNLAVLGIFHSHPDHPNRPSEFDREWALPWFSYVITSVTAGKALQSRSWRLNEDRTRFDEEMLAAVAPIWVS